MCRKICLLASLVISLAGFLIPQVAWSALPAAQRQEEPSRVLKEIQRGQELPRAKSAEVVTPKDEKEAGLPGADKIKFKLHRVDIQGATAFSDAELQEIFADKIGRTITLADLEHSVDTITLKYRNAGYVISRAILPPQRINKSGAVTIQVIEGHVAHTSIDGNASRSVRRLLEAYGSKIAASKPLDIKTLERYALLANDLPGVTARVVLAPSPTTPAAADLTFVIEQQRIDGYISIDNYGSDVLGREQYSAGLFMNNLLVGASQTGVRGLLAEDDEVKYIEGSHIQHIGDNGIYVQFTANYIDTDPDFSVVPDGSGLLDINGQSYEYTGTINYPLIRSRKKNLYVYGKFDSLNSRTSLGNSVLSEDRIRSVRIGTILDFSDRFRGINLLSAEVSGGTEFQDPDPKFRYLSISRLSGHGDYAKMNAAVSRLQALPKNFSLLLAGEGQYAFDSLLSAEEYGFGGRHFGRGYDPSEILGDHGLAGKAELRYDFEIANKFVQKVQLFGFYDAGAVWNRNTPAQNKSDSATSAGAGLRVTANKYLHGSIEYAKPLSKVVTNEGDKDGRLYFTVTAHA